MLTHMSVLHNFDHVPQMQQFGPAAAASLQPGRANSPCSSPMFTRMGSNMATPFNRRVAVVYDTTASGRFLLKWATSMVLEPADNVFVVRAVPKVRCVWQVVVQLFVSSTIHFKHHAIARRGTIQFSATGPCKCLKGGCCFCPHQMLLMC